MTKIKVWTDQPIYRKFIAGSEYITNPKNADVIVFSGGSDVSPVLYGDKESSLSSVIEKRDSADLKIFDMFKNKKAMIGVCRGSQFLTAMAGGKLFQHVSGHSRGGMHKVYSTREAVDKYDISYMTTVTSTHHQMMNPFEMDEKDYELIMFADALSGFYIDGEGFKDVYDAYEHFREPEVVYYSNINALAIQGHPERMGSITEMNISLNRLIKDIFKI